MSMDFPSSPVNGQTTTDGRYYFDSSVGSSGAWRSTPLPVGGLPAGSIIQWGSGTLPNNWLLCDGSAVSRSVYSSLFAAIGTQYGSGNGTTTFNLPDIPAGDTAGVVANVKLSTAINVSATNADLAGATASVNFKAGRVYRIVFSSANLNGSVSGRIRLTTTVDNTAIDRHYVGLIAGNGGTAFNISTLYTPTVDGAGVVRVQGAIDTGTGTSMTVYADATSNIFLTVEDMGEAVGSSLRQRYIIKASAGWTAGDSELATRVGALEASGTVVQVVSASTQTQVNITSTSKQSTGLTATITPKFSNSRILVTATSTNFQNAANRGDYAVFRNGSELTIGCSSNTTGVHNDVCSGTDIPGGTSAVTYNLRASITSGTLETNWAGFPGSITLMEVRA